MTHQRPSLPHRPGTPCLASETGWHGHSQLHQALVPGIPGLYQHLGTAEGPHSRTEPEYSSECLEAQVNAKRDAHKLNRDVAMSSATRLRATIPTSLQRAMDLAQEKGASTWLTSLPLEEFGLTLHKGAFRDAIALRYGWHPLHTPTSCACGTNFSVEHALSCPMGGFPTIRHNEVRDLTAT